MGPRGSDLTLALPEVTLAADKMEQARGSRSPPAQQKPVGSGRQTCSQVQPQSYGAPSSRSRAAQAERRRRALLRRWFPGQDVESVDRDGTAFRLPPNAVLRCRSTTRRRGRPRGNHRRTGAASGCTLLHNPAAGTCTSSRLPIHCPASPLDRRLKFTHTIGRAVDALALSPDDVPANITLTAAAVLPNGSRVAIGAHAHARADWARRYWFERPIPLPAGTGRSKSSLT